ncbi:MAG: GHKL domain-containing protein [Clostridium sp.]|nr:GHKL domain-containing protein [Clostridium sp.]
MIDRICVVLEALSVVICLHHLYGKKFRFDIVTVCFLTIEMIAMQSIDYFGLPSELSMLFYPFVAIYCVVEFGFNLKELLINNILYLVIVGILQIVVMMVFYVINNQQVLDGIRPLISNGIILLITIVVFPKIRIKHLSDLLKNKEKVLMIALTVCIVIISFCLIDFKKINIIKQFDLFQYILFSICIIMIGFLGLKMGKYKVKSKEIETELKMHGLYANSFDSLIDNIRSRQHEFDNHINTIYSQHYLYNNYEELVKAQKDYCRIVTTENKFNKLLTSGNRIIIGFLYGKFVEVDRLGIDISYHISINELQVGVPIYKLVEILGNLIGNATEALMELKNGNKLYVLMIEKENEFKIEVRNESDYINYAEIGLFFTKGYSKKGENRGLGLFHVKSICDEYQLKLSCKNKEIEEKNWISFIVSNNENCILEVDDV